MRRSPKPAKAKGESTRPVARKSEMGEGSRVGALEERLAEALEQQTATSEILRVISRSPSDLQPVLAAVVLNASRLCGAANVSLYRVEGTLMRKVAEEGAELTSLRVNETRPITRTSISGRAIIERTTIYVPDHQAAEAAREYPDARRDTGIRTTIAIPLLRDGIAIGAFTAYRIESRPFAEHEIALLRTFADQAAIAIENVRLFTELQGKNRELATALDQQTATSEILRTISRSPTNVQPVFNTVVQSGLRLLGGYSATMMLLRDDARLDLVAYTSTSAEADASLVHAFPMPLRRIPAGERAVHERRAHAVEDIESAEDATDVMRETGRAADGAATSSFR
jgi:two-component system NtrC family sensor kinase